MGSNHKGGGCSISAKCPTNSIMRRISFDSSSNFFLLFLFILVIISDQGVSHQKNGSGTARQRWLQYQTALSNTGPLGSPAAPPGTMSSDIVNPNANVSIRSSPSSSISPPTTTTTTTVGTTKIATSTKAFAVVPRGSSGNINSYNSNRNNYFGAGRRRIPTTYDGFPDSLFENNTSVNITVPLGDTAFLRCRVKNLGERSISWIRRRDWHILTTGKITYTNDERFHVLHTEGTDDWTLQIKFVQARDNGTYECQISTGTGIISFLVNLMIAVPEAFILGNGDEYHVEQGSTINLVCVIEKSPKVPEYIFWYHNDRMINYGSSREVTVRTEPGIRTQSRLTIHDALPTDSGNYSCKITHVEPASIFVYVSQASGLFSGDKIAAIQRRTNNSPSDPSSASSRVHVQQSFFILIIISVITITLQYRSQTMAVSIFAGVNAF